MTNSASMSVVVLISGSGSNLQAIIDATAGGSIPARISAVISNKADAYGLQRAENSDIPTAVLDHKKYESRELFDQALQALIDSYQPDLVVLAGFMRILTPKFVKYYHGKMLNIHPSLLPKYRGINTHARVLEDNAKVHGVTVHFVVPELDGGPLIIQAKIPVKENDTVDTLAKRVLTQEHKIYPLVVQWFVSERLKLDNNQIYLDGERLDQPIQYQEDLLTE